MASDVESARSPIYQLSLFEPAWFEASPREIARETGVAWAAILWLREHGWLSFDPERVAQIECDTATELIFLASLVKSGCDNAMLELLLKNLKRPYSYDIGQIYWHWGDGEWKFIPVEEEILPEEVLDVWLEELVSQADTETLATLVDQIRGAFEQIEEPTESCARPEPLDVSGAQFFVVKLPTESGAKSAAKIMQLSLQQSNDTSDATVIVKKRRIYVTGLPKSEFWRLSHWRALWSWSPPEPAA